MKLTRDKIQRMVGSQGLVSSGAAGGGCGTIGITEQRVMEILQDYETIEDLEDTLEDYVTTTALETTLADYATKSYVDQNYLSLSFFNALFQARTSLGALVSPNNGDVSTIDNIKAMFGFWTDQYLSALGQGADGGGGSAALSTLMDVHLSYPLNDGEVLTYNVALGKWTNGTGVSADWADITGKPTTIAGYGITDAHITNGVITLGSNSITPITSLSGYATESWVNTLLADYVTTSGLATTLADYVTTTALATTLADYATKSYVDQNYLSLSFFNALFQARTSAGVAVAPNNGDTSTIDNIKAMFGFWTDQYISALGQGADGGAVTSLASLTDVELSTPINDGEVLTYSTTLGKWTNGTGVSTSWANITGKPTTIAGYGITDAHITNGVITLGSNSITPITSLSGYATESWVQQQGYITGITSSMVTGALGYTPANSTALSNYLPLSGGTISGTNRDLLTLNNTGNSAIGSYLEFSINGTHKGLVGYNSSFGIFLNGFDSSGNLESQFYIDKDNAYFAGNDRQFKTMLHSGNSSVSKSGSTLSVKINGTTESLTDSWRGMQNNLTTSSSSTSDSLSAYQGYLLANGSARDNTKLPLSGGTLTSTDRLVLTLNQNGSGSGQGAYIRFKFNNSGTDYVDVGYNTTTGAFIGNIINNSSHWLVMKESSITYNNWDIITSNNIGSQSVSYATSAGTATDPTKLPLAGGTLIGALTINTSSYPLRIQTSGNESSMVFAANGSTASYGQYVLGGYVQTTSGSPAFFLYDATLGYQTLHIENGRVGIGTRNNYPSYALHVGGDIVATGDVAGLSDERDKEVLGDLNLSVNQIALMPTVLYRWNDGRDDRDVHVGTLAQRWEGTLPQVVKKANDERQTRSFGYGVAALISAIVTARKVVNHEERIEALEREYADLQQAYSDLKNDYDYLKMDYDQLRLKIA